MSIYACIKLYGYCFDIKQLVWPFNIFDSVGYIPTVADQA